MSNVLDKIKRALEQAGLGDRDGFYGTCMHSCGLPNGRDFVVVRPDWSPIDGAHCVVVTAEAVETYCCPYPSNHCDWSLCSQATYTTPEAMVSLVRERVEQPKGCW